MVLALLANYSGFLFCRLYRATPGAVLFGDIGFKAAGSMGRNLVYVTIYSLDAIQCVLLHLAATQSLRHIFPADGMPSIWQAGAAVVVIASVLVPVYLQDKSTLDVYFCIVNSLLGLSKSYYPIIYS